MVGKEQDRGTYREVEGERKTRGGEVGLKAQLP